MSKPLDIHLHGSTLYLEGHLAGGQDVAGQLQIALQYFNGLELEISAQNLTVVPEGATAWIDAVLQHLPKVSLLYRSSQLGMIIAYDERYTHNHTRIED